MRRWLVTCSIAGCLRGVPDTAELAPAPVAPLPPEPAIAPADRGEGPLSLELVTGIEVVPRHREHHDRALPRHRLSRTEVVADTAAIEAFVQTYAGSESDRHAQTIAVRELRAIEHHGWTFEAWQDRVASIVSELGACVVTGSRPTSCFVRTEPVPPRSGLAPFELRPNPTGVIELVVRDLEHADDPRWFAFAAARQRLATATGIVIDLSHARGSDPRPLLGWLEELTGRAPLRPIAAIERPAAADRDAAAYAARYLVESRDRAVWDALVGTMPPAAPHPATPIAIVVGPGCEAACELVARVLATYADAAIYGQIFQGGRLARDEPARVALPSSPISILFFATRYRLAPEIEAATGPTDHWNEAHPFDGIDLEAFAIRDVEQRAHGGWGRCDRMPAFHTAAALPPALRVKFPDAATWSKPRCARASLVVHADAAFAAIERFVATCNRQIELRANQYGHELTGTAPSFEVLSQLIASPLISHIDVTCARSSEL